MTELQRRTRADKGRCERQIKQNRHLCVWGVFCRFALVVSLIKGIVPIYLVEAAVWAGAAWYWHRTKTHSELAKGIVIVFAALVAIGEVISDRQTVHI